MIEPPRNLMEPDPNAPPVSLAAALWVVVVVIALVLVLIIPFLGGAS